MSVIQWNFATAFRIRVHDSRAAVLFNWEPLSTDRSTTPIRCGPIESVEQDVLEREMSDGTRVPWVRGWRKRFTTEWIVQAAYVTTGSSGSGWYQYLHNVVGAASGGGYLMVSLDSGSTWYRANVVEFTQENLSGKNVGLRVKLVLELAQRAQGPGCQSWATVLD